MDPYDGFEEVVVGECPRGWSERPHGHRALESVPDGGLVLGSNPMQN
jgi:hypothetical protein